MPSYTFSRKIQLKQLSFFEGFKGLIKVYIDELHISYFAHFRTPQPQIKTLIDTLLSYSLEENWPTLQTRNPQFQN